jgi:hypothetical protein
MKAYARKCARWLQEGHRVWMLFNNGFYGYPIENARLLERYITAGLGKDGGKC